MTIKFFRKTKNEAKTKTEKLKFTKWLILLGHVSCFALFGKITLSLVALLTGKKLLNILKNIFLLIGLLPIGYNAVKWMRLLRVQVQLKTEKENTNEIIR